MHKKSQSIKASETEKSIEEKEHESLYNETSNLPRIKYYWRQKVYKEKIFTEDQKMRASSPTCQQNNNSSTHTLQSTHKEKMKISILHISKQQK